jgi:hypothetical protein
MRAGSLSATILWLITFNIEGPVELNLKIGGRQINFSTTKPMIGSKHQ